MQEVMKEALTKRESRTNEKLEDFAAKSSVDAAPWL